MSPTYRVWWNGEWVDLGGEGGPSNPGDIPGLVGWWKAGDLEIADGAAVASWPDASGNSHTMNQPTSANRPIFRTAPAGFNGHPAVEFDGANDTLVTDPQAFAPTEGVTLFAVVRPSSLASIRGIVAKTNGTAPAPFDWYIETNGVVRFLTATGNNNIATGPVVATGTTYVLAAQRLSTSVAVGFVGDSVASFGHIASNADAATKGIVLGGRDGGALPFAGHIAEALVYNAGLTFPQAGGVLSHLTTKYGL